MITFLTGPMKAGKSHRLLLEIAEYQQCGLDYLVIKPKVDTRNGDKVVSRATEITHDALMIDENNTEHYKALMAAMDNCRCLFIDEVQFFSAKALEILLAHAYNVDCDVLASGLTRDFLHNMFPAAQVLHEVAIVVELIESCEICEENDALYNVRVDSTGQLVEHGGQLGVEGEHTYKSVCGGCKEGLRNVT